MYSYWELFKSQRYFNIIEFRWEETIKRITAAGASGTLRRSQASSCALEYRVHYIIRQKQVY